MSMNYASSNYTPNTALIVLPENKNIIMVSYRPMNKKY